jgi:hypothetical protein
MLFFFLLKSLRTEVWNRFCLESRGWHQQEGKDIRKGCRRVNVVEYYALMYENGKMRPVETIPGMGGGIRENDGGVNSTMTFDTL